MLVSLYYIGNDSAWSERVHATKPDLVDPHLIVFTDNVVVAYKGQPMENTRYTIYVYQSNLLG